MKIGLDLHLTLIFYKEIKLLYITIIILIGICCSLIYLLSQKKEYDEQLEIKNRDLLVKNNQLREEEKQLKIFKNNLSIEINQLNQSKDELFNKVAEQQRIFEESKATNENIAQKAYENYMLVLESYYKEAETIFDSNMISLKTDITKLNQELDKLKATRAAAHEALLKEQEVKENKDNYRLLPSQADLADVRRLEIVKRELNKPRILSMLIWKTYYQPIAQKQFPTILQAKTKIGIYKITNLITDECYIGQAVDIYKRWNDHCKCGLGIDTPPGNKLYKSMQEYGLENFTFELLTECKQNELNEKEKYFIELYQANIYGMNSTGGNR